MSGGLGMTRNGLTKAAASSLIMATSMVGCTGTAVQGGPSLTAAKPGQAPSFAAAAEKALAARKFAVALPAAEAAVEAEPNNGAYRTLLGRAYLANGRFASAEAAFRDAMTLGNADSRTVVSLSLIRVAMGDSAGARRLLANEADRIPAVDYGLAVAMAGDADEGVRILSEAIHAPSATAQTRQNLAYAYALAGHWREARIMAEQDVDPKVAAARVLGWAGLAQPGAEPQRVAALLGVTPRADDSGMPVRLALSPATPVMAEAAPTPVITPATAEPVLTAVVDDAPVIEPVGEPAPAIAVATPRQVRAAPAMIQPVPVPASGTPIAVAPPVAAPSPRRAPAQAQYKRTAFITPAAGLSDSASAWVVQLGAYDSVAVAREKWDGISRRNGLIAGMSAINSSVTVDGRLYYRLAVGGFADRSGADGLCRAIRAQGSSCFVRQGDASAKTQRWAAAKGTVKRNSQLAMR